MRVMQNFCQGVDVYFLQRLLNKAASRSPGGPKRIAEDGRFGGETEAAVRAFQALPRALRLKLDGVVGPLTWAALGVSVEIDHRITLRAQRTDWNCWQAAATMVAEARGRPISVATSPRHMQYYLASGLPGNQADVQLARELGWRQLSHSPSLPELISIMGRTPIYVAGLLTAIGGAHAVAFGGLYSDGNPDGTVIKVYNPSPIGIGSIHQFFYTDMVSPISGSPFVPRDFLVPP